MGALGLGYLDTPVFFWAAQLPGGLGADQTRPDQVLKGRSGQVVDWAGWQTARQGSLSQGPDDQPTTKGRELVDGPHRCSTGAVHYRG